MNDSRKLKIDRLLENEISINGDEVKQKTLLKKLCKHREVRIDITSDNDIDIHVSRNESYIAITISECTLDQLNNLSKLVQEAYGKSEKIDLIGAISHDDFEIRFHYPPTDK